MPDKPWGFAEVELYQRLWLPILNGLGYTRMLRRMLQQLPAPRIVLDVGAGTGAATRVLLDSFPDATVCALDLAPACLKRCRVVMQGRYPQRVHYIQGGAAQLPFADGTFDAVACFLLVCHLPEPAQIVAEIARVLRPGGVALVFTRTYDGLGRLLQGTFPLLYQGNLYLYAEHELNRVFMQRNFASVATRTVGHGVYVRAVK